MIFINIYLALLDAIQRQCHLLLHLQQWLALDLELMVSFPAIPSFLNEFSKCLLMRDGKPRRQKDPISIYNAKDWSCADFCFAPSSLVERGASYVTWGISKIWKCGEVTMKLY